MLKEYKTVSEISGPLLIVEGVEGVKYEELVEVKMEGETRTRLGKVLEISDKYAMVQLFESPTGLDVKNSKVRFLGKGVQLSVSPDILGRVFDGMGNPIDGGSAGRSALATEIP